ncbi:aspartate/glutamate racemase family protein [Telmatospirillum sp.]|uniref:glutamate racemase n=1 Tax=Telmatospirillum sp. TaxID=2079197 RepID=UPI0028515C73|nr:aspartate/glutamate racemase family protein [Telmatospirillum sp.]MDR3439180.1 aspartate/glutamate racemase family protein [Telmatospirillum sp.]
MIGVFDSGFGGLTVLRALVDALPDRQFVYLGDHRAATYGNRSRDEIYDLARHAMEELFGLDCRLIVVACNTVAATSLRRLQREWLPACHPDRRILGVLVPMVEAITGVPWMADLPTRPIAGRKQTIAVFATRQTVLSNAFPVEIGKRAPEVTVVQQACPKLASLIEAGAAPADMAVLVRRYVEAMMDQLQGHAPDVVMLGCTHYPLVADLFSAALPRGIEILSQPTLVARSLTAYLAHHPEFDDCGDVRPPLFFTSGEPDIVSRLGSQFFGRPVIFRTIGQTRTPAIRESIAI